MDDNKLREVAKAALHKVIQVSDDNQSHEDGDVAYEFRQLLISNEFKALAVALKPTREEVADRLEHVAEAYGHKPDNINVQALNQAIKYLREE